MKKWRISKQNIKGDRDDAIREKADTAGHSKMSRLSHLGEKKHEYNLNILKPLESNPLSLCPPLTPAPIPRKCVDNG
jgi:hypothetical protein